MLELAGLWGCWLHFLACVYKTHLFIKGGGVAHVSGKVSSVKSNLKKDKWNAHTLFSKSKDDMSMFLEKPHLWASFRKCGWVQLNVKTTSHWLIAALGAWLLSVQCISQLLFGLVPDVTKLGSVLPSEQVQCVLLVPCHFRLVILMFWMCKSISALALWQRVWELWADFSNSEDKIAASWMTAASLSCCLPM